MYIVEEIKRINRLHRLILSRRTGTPDELARTLFLSRRQMYNILDEMKSLGAQIAYSRTEHTFYYTNKFDITVFLKIKNMDKKENIE